MVATSFNKPNIIITEPDRLSPIAWQRLNEFGQIIKGPFNRKGLLNNISKSNIALVRLGHRIDREIIESAKNLKIIASPTTGLDHIDTERAAKKSIKIISLQGQTDFLSNIHATAELSWTLILCICRNITAACDNVKRGIWNRDLFWGIELSGKTIGLIGFGRVGRRMAKYANAFDMNIIATDPIAVNIPDFVNMVQLHELLKKSDIVSIHVPLTISTENLIGDAELKIMKSDSYLINTSRGGIVDESALIKYLKSGHLGGAALDVIHDEIEKDNKWFLNNELIKYAKQNHNLIITPHIGGVTFDSIHKTEEFIVESVIQYWNSIVSCSS